MPEIQHDQHLTEKSHPIGWLSLVRTYLRSGPLSSRPLTQCEGLTVKLSLCGDSSLKVNRLSRSNALLGSQPHSDGPSPITQAYINGTTIQSGAESLVLIKG